MATPPKRHIIWPDRYHPSRCPVHVVNEWRIQARAETVWAWLTRAALWPTWYDNSQHVLSLGEHPFGDLALGSQFQWKTFGFGIRSEVLEFVPHERLAWNATGFGVDAYHAWLLTPQGDHCHVLTEETQTGWGARLMHFLRPHRMSDGHDLWLKSLDIVARRGEPPQL